MYRSLMRPSTRIWQSETPYTGVCFAKAFLHLYRGASPRLAAEMHVWLAVETAFTVTFGRAGEDNKRFKLGSVEQTLAGFAGADYQLQVPPPPPPLSLNLV